MTEDAPVFDIGDKVITNLPFAPSLSGRKGIVAEIKECEGQVWYEVYFGDTGESEQFTRYEIINAD